ncbi:hypothetical protein [Chthoniobacter flavus]|uniref:hypothetical protein n=1 Tax=Chthoniobacter flavus TaxID=191863 RepID=UPI0012FB29B5|nr:hypothetical protein [Chthoniobacter flavus]
MWTWKMVSPASSTKRNGRRNEFSSRSFKLQGSAYFFLAAAFFFGAAFLAAVFLAAGFLAASFFAGFFAAGFLVAIDNPPFQSAGAVRRKFG